MIHQELLRRAVSQEDHALQDFVETLAPSILMHLASVPALGGSGKPPVIAGLEIPAGLKTYTAQDYARLTRGGKQEDQSMATHLLNGIFAAMRLAKWLPEAKQLSDLEKRLWILGYICHDYTKIYGIQVSAGDVPLIKQLNQRLGELMNFGAFLPEWRDYLGDISFLAQNTQTKESSNLQANLFQPKHDLRRLNNPLRILSSIADVLVHVKSPAEVAIALERSTDQNLREKMVMLFGADDTPRFTYHKLTEVRGLLSNIINNAVMAAMQEQGAEPFLFFPNGVVYITGQSTVQADFEKIADNAWERVLSVVTDDENFGIRRGGTGFVISSALIELIGLEGVLQIAKRKALNINAGYAVARLYGYFTGKSNNDLINELGKDEERIKAEQTRVVSAHKLPDDVRVDQVGEFLTFVYRFFDKEYKADIAPMLLQALGLDSKIAPEDALKQKGGTYFGWYYVAAKYIEANPRVDIAQIDVLLENICSTLVNFSYTSKKAKKKSPRIQDFIAQYVFEHLEVHGSFHASLSFERQLSNYMESKKAKKPVCSMCGLHYPSTLQEANETLFVNQQYSNKNPLGYTIVTRGICPVCRMEIILRKIAHPRADENQKPIFIWIYPTYFFTLETSEVVREFRNRFQEISESPRYLLEHLHKSDFSMAKILTYDRFLPPHKDDEQENEATKFSEYDFAGISYLVLQPPKPPKGKKLTETDQWAVPTFHTLALPLLLDVKVVATTSFVPIFSSGAEFPETAILDAPHQFTRYVLGKDRFRVDELPEAVIRLLRLYDLHLDVYGDGKDSHWAQINEVAAAVKTDPLNVFMYYDRKKRGKEKGEKKSKGKSKGGAKSNQLVPRFDVERYHQTYLTLGGEENMGIIGKLVDAYAAFYRTRTFKKEPSAYAIVRPLDELINATLKTDPKLERDDLALTLCGTLADVMERVWNDSVKDATDPIIFEKNSSRPMEERKRLSRQKQEEFVELFLSGLFEGLCQGQRAVLQENANRYRSAAKFHYLKHYYYSNPTEAQND